MVIQKKPDLQKLKASLKIKCKKSIIDLCSNAELNDYETNLILITYSELYNINGICKQLHISTTKYTRDYKKVLLKIQDYIENYKTP